MATISNAKKRLNEGKNLDDAFPTPKDKSKSLTRKIIDRADKIKTPKKGKNDTTQPNSKWTKGFDKNKLDTSKSSDNNIWKERHGNNNPRMDVGRDYHRQFKASKEENNLNHMDSKMNPKMSIYVSKEGLAKQKKKIY